MLFAIEDIHWADRSTLEFLSSLVRGLRDERLLLVCTYRSDELHRQHPLRPFLAEEERRDRRRAPRGRPPSRRPSSPSRWRASSATPPSPDLVARLHARSEGNAFFAEELLAASDAGAGPLPSNLRDVLNLRLEALPDDARGVLRVAAAAGRRSGHRLLAAVAGLPEPALVEALREAVAQHVLVQDADGYAFRHALLQEAAYADLLPGERTALHLALAEALRDDPSLADGHGGGRARAALARGAPDARGAGGLRRARGWRPSRSSPSSRPRSTSSARWRSGTSSPDAERALASSTCCGSCPRGAQHGHRRRAPPRGHARAHGASSWPTGPATSSPRRWPASASAATLWLAGDSDGALAAYRDAVRVLPARAADGRAGARAGGRGPDPHAPRARRRAARGVRARDRGRPRGRRARHRGPRDSTASA